MTGRPVHHVVYDTTVASDLDLGLPPASAGATTDRRVEVVERDGPIDPTTVDRWSGDTDDDTLKVGLAGPDLVFHLADEVDLTVAADGRTIEWYAHDEPDETVVHLVIDHALPHALMRQGSLVLHGSSALDRAGRAVVVAGRSGWGKSSLATALVDRGFTLLADDCADVDWRSTPPTVAAGYPGVRLRTASARALPPSVGLAATGTAGEATGKIRYDVTGSRPDGRGRHPLVAVFVLDPDPGSEAGDEAVAQSGVAAALALLPHSFHFGTGPERELTLDRAIALGAGCPVFRLPYRHTAAGLTAALDAVEASLPPA